MKSKFNFNRSFVFVLLILILGSATIANGQPGCERTATDRRIMGSITKKIAQLKRANPRRHIDITALVLKNKATIITKKTARVYVNQIVRYARSFSYIKKVGVDDPHCLTDLNCTIPGTKHCGGNCVPCDCKCRPRSVKKRR